MDNFCKFCGKKTEQNQNCTCPEAVAELKNSQDNSIAHTNTAVESDDSIVNRCDWAHASSADIIYHDTEWGRPIFDDRLLFEKINLEAMQSGLSWTTILNKRDNFRTAFDNFNAKKIAEYDDTKRAELLLDAGIVRNRLKIDAVINNAKAYLNLMETGETLSDFFWKYVDYKPVTNRWKRLEEVPPFTETSTAIAKELKRRGFKFVGPTTIYALMQSAGLVNDHLVDCSVWKEVNELA